MKKAQLSIEFFLIASFLIALAVIVITTTETQLNEVKALDRAALSKAALDSSTATINLAAAGGEGTQTSATIFIPESTACLILNLNASEPRLECDADPSLSGRVHGRPLYTSQVSFDSSCPLSNPNGGWIKLIAKNMGDSVSVRCQERN